MDDGTTIHHRAVLTTIDRCANTRCTNLPHEGQFVLVAIDDTTTLIMCSPCAHKLTGVRA